MWRRQPPTWSPVTSGMIWRGASAALGQAFRGASATGNSAPDLLARELSQEIGAQRVLLTGSGTDALTLAIAGSATGRPRVALPAWGCPDLATAADGADARVLLYDLDPRTLGPDLDSLARAVKGGVDTIVVASYFGLPVDSVPIDSIASTAGALVIDDAAQGVGGWWLGRPLGARGDLGILSFGRGKGRTGGSGGALLAATDRGAAVLEKLPVLPSSATSHRELAILIGLGLLARPAFFRIPASLPFLRLGESIYHPPRPPERISSVAAAVLRAGAASAQREARSRRQAGQWWIERLRGHSEVSIIEPVAGAEPGWLRFPVVVSPGWVGRFAAPSIRDLGVMPGYPVPLGRLPGFDRRVESIQAGGYPGAELLAARLFTLPTHSLLRRADRDRLVALILHERSRFSGEGERGNR